MNKIKYSEHCKAFRELQKQVDEIVGRRRSIQVYEAWDDVEAPIHLQVNWSCRGAVSVEEAREFCNQFEAVLKLAENYKYNGYIVDFDED